MMNNKLIMLLIIFQIHKLYRFELYLFQCFSRTHDIPIATNIDRLLSVRTKNRIHSLQSNTKVQIVQMTKINTKIGIIITKRF